MLRIAGILWCVLVGCTGSVDDLEALEALESETRAMAGDGSCDEEASCATVGFGSKPCGGPWEYLVYCASDIDEEALLAKVEEYNAMEAEYNALHEIGSDCAEEADPGAMLVDGVCVPMQ